MPQSRTAVAPPAPQQGKLPSHSPGALGDPPRRAARTDSQRTGPRHRPTTGPEKGTLLIAPAEWIIWDGSNSLSFLGEHGGGTDGFNFSNVAGNQPDSSLSGYVYVDANNNGKVDTGEPSLGGVTVVLSGTNSLGSQVTATTTTETDGSYHFQQLLPGHLRHHRDRPDRLRRRQGHHRQRRRHGRARHVHRHRAGVGRQRRRLRLRLGAHAGVHQHGGHTGRRGRVVFLSGDGDRRRRRPADILPVARPQHHDGVRGRPGLLGPRHQRRRHAPDRRSRSATAAAAWRGRRTTSP